MSYRNQFIAGPALIMMELNISPYKTHPCGVLDGKDSIKFRRSIFMVMSFIF